MMREWIARQADANERIKNQVVELERKSKSKEEVVGGIFKSSSIRNENDKGDIEVIEEYETETIPTMPKPSLIKSNSPTISPFLKDCTVHIPYTNAKTFADVVIIESCW
ncbi:hypothetical protein Tco_1381392 [Tanacetum coccineum]